MKAPSRETPIIVAGFIVLFIGLGILSVFLATGESRRARILVEYEADRIASSLADSFRAAGSIDQAALDPRIRGFALYGPDGSAVVRVGDAPENLDASPLRSGFTYERRRSLLTLQRFFGVAGPGMMGSPPQPGEAGTEMRDMMRGMMGGSGGPGGEDRRGSGFGRLRGGSGRGPEPDASGPRYGLRHPGFSGAGPMYGPRGGLFLALDISAYYRSQLLYRSAALAAPLVIAGLAALFLLLLLSNIRHRRRAQEQETLARLGESARTLAHEIRNPLSAIRIQTGLLRKKLPGEAAAQLEAIEEEVGRLSLLSRRVSDFLKNPRGDPQRVPVDEFLVDLALRQATPVAYTATDGRGNLAVTMDRELLRSVVENLLRNARESYPDGEAGPVELVLASDRAGVVISVLDRGKGIPPELAQKVFDPFFTDKVHGSGVGLSLSRRFIVAAGGDLQLLPRPGGGTEARVTLPTGGAG